MTLKRWLAVIIITTSVLILFAFNKLVLSETRYKIYDYEVNLLGSGESVTHLPNFIKSGFLFLHGGGSRYIVPLTKDNFLSNGYKLNLPESGEYELLKATDLDLTDENNGVEAPADENWMSVGRLNLKRWQEPFNFDCCVPRDLMMNGSFEADPWESNGDVSFSSDSVDGTRSVRLTGGDEGNASVSGDLIGVEGDKFYDVSFLSKNIRGDRLILKISEVYENLSGVESVNYIDNFYNWERSEFTFKTHRQTKFLGISFSSSKRANRETVNLVDDVKVFEKYKPAGILIKNIDTGEEAVYKPNVSDFTFFSLLRVDPSGKDRTYVIEGPQSRFRTVFDLDNVSFVQTRQDDSVFGISMWRVTPAANYRTFISVNYIPLLILFVTTILLSALKLANYGWILFFKAAKTGVVERVFELRRKFEHKREKLISFLLVSVILIVVYLSNFFQPLFTSMALVFISLSSFYYLARLSRRTYLCMGMCFTELGFILSNFNKVPMILDIFTSEFRLMIAANRLVYLGIFNLFIVVVGLFSDEYLKNRQPKS